MEPNLTIERAAVADLVPYARNSKEHPAEQVDAIAESMRRFGMCDPVGVWTNANGALEIVEGHGRVMAAQRLGIRELPIIRLDHLTDEERRAYSHVHNQTTLTSGLDMDVLRLDMEDLPEFDWGALGFEEPEREPDPEDVLEDEPPENVPTRCEPGDVWQLGRHRLMCGDASEPADVETLLAGVRPMFVFADPPYGVAVGSRNKTLNDATPGKGGAARNRHCGRHHGYGHPARHHRAGVPEPTARVRPRGQLLRDRPAGRRPYGGHAGAGGRRPARAAQPSLG